MTLLRTTPDFSGLLGTEEIHNHWTFLDCRGHLKYKEYYFNAEMNMKYTIFF